MDYPRNKLPSNCQKCGLISEWLSTIERPNIIPTLVQAHQSRDRSKNSNASYNTVGYNV